MRPVGRKRKRRYTAPALEKGLEILELLVKHSRPMSMAEIAEEMGRSKNEIFRMVNVLQVKHYIERLDNDRLGITNKLFELGIQFPPVSTLLEIALPQMRQLSLAVQQACHLAVLSDDQIVVIARIESPAAVGFSVRTGHRRIVTESGSGRLFLAWMNEADREALLRASKRPTRASLERELAAIRKRGISVLPSTVAKGITDVCVPILRRSDGQMLASLAIPYTEGSSAGVSLERTSQLLIKVAQGISSRLGTGCDV
jgi:DNA-binding IclR family transcriptional regulator